MRNGIGLPIAGEGALLVTVHADDPMSGLEVGKVPQVLALHTGVEVEQVEIGFDDLDLKLFRPHGSGKRVKSRNGGGPELCRDDGLTVRFPVGQLLVESVNAGGMWPVCVYQP